MNLTQGTAREPIAADQVASLRAAGVLIEDIRRERPRYFDGRFLAARDLIRDQQYFLTREADLGQAAGSGVAAGLFVEQGDAPQTLAVTAGHGVTPTGELVLLPREITVQLANIPVAEQLSAKFGLSRIPQPPMRSRTGLFVLALRPVEFTANPIGAYPTSITGQRTVEDGDVIEATAVVLVPWQDDGAADVLDARRGRAARAIFTQGGSANVSANVLPLAMIALQNNTVVWIDEPLVRRELGSDRGDLPGLGFAPRGLRLAHLMQYQSHLADVESRAGGRAFPATAHFPSLPSAGPLPEGVINPQDFTQNFFPAEIDVDFTIIPEDELPALVEEAMALQPIDLMSPPEALDSTAVMILAPVPRHQWRAVLARLATVQRVVKPAAPNLIAQRKPFEVLQKLRVPRLAAETLDPSNVSDAEWQRLAKLGTLWFVRRRHLAYRDDLVGSYKEISGVDERAQEIALRSQLTKLGLTSKLDSILASSSPAAASTITSMLASKKFQESPVLTAAALGSLSDAVSKSETAEGGTALDKASVLKVASDLSAPGTGDGLSRIVKEAGTSAISTEALQKIAANADWKKIDSSAQVVNQAEVIKIGDTVFKPGTPIKIDPAKPVEPLKEPVKEPVKEATGTPVKPVVTEPVNTPTKPVAQPTKPAEEVVKPVVVAEPAKPVAEPVKPVAEPVKPVAEPVKPVVAEPVKPVVVAEPVKPVVAQPVKPVVVAEPVKPVAQPTKPIVASPTVLKTGTTTPIKTPVARGKAATAAAKPAAKTAKPAKASKAASTPKAAPKAAAKKKK